MKKNEIDLLIHKYRGRNPLRTLWFMMSRSPFKLFLSIILYILKLSVVWVIPVATGNIIDAVKNSSDGSIHIITINSLVVVGFLILNITSTGLFTTVYSKLKRTMEQQLRMALVLRLQQLSISFHENFRSGKMYSKVLRDVESIENLSQYLMSHGFESLVGALGVFIYAFTKNPIVAVFFIITVPLALVFIRLVRKYLTNNIAKYRITIESMASRISEMIEMIPVTRAYNAEQIEIEKVDKHLEEVKAKGRKVDVNISLFSAGGWTIMQFFALASLAFTAVISLKGYLTIGEVVTYYTFFTLLINKVNMTLGIYPMFAKGFDAIRSIGEILECPDLEENEGKKQIKKVEGSFNFQNVSFAYEKDGKNAIQDITLNIKKGETIAIVGESGSGKTTLINLIIGFRRPVKGKILLDGSNMAELDLRDYRKHLAVVIQNTILFNGSIKDNITYGLDDVSEQQLKKALEMANAYEFVSRLPQGVYTPIGEHGAKLSGGQRQRLAIARALIRDPKIIIFDEATSNLDVKSEYEVQKAIDTLIKDRTTFIVAHRLSTIRNADRIIVLQNGKCIEQGTHQDLLKKKGMFHSLSKLQN